VLVTVLAFLFAVRLLGTATDAAAPALETVFRRVVVGTVSALGVGWLAAYVLANGSVVAALAVSVFTADVIGPERLFLALVGSRLGAAAVVVLVGALDYLGERRSTLRESVSVGLLTFLVTHSVYLPVAALGVAGVATFGATLPTVGPDLTVDLPVPGVFDAVTVAVTARVGPTVSVLLAVGLLFVTLRLFDRLLSTVDATTLERVSFEYLRRPWLSFVLGVAVTAASTSVAFSLGVVVALSNRGYIDRETLVPYVLGANVGTLVDTLAVAVVLGSGTAVALVLTVLGLATVVTGAFLLAGDGYSRRVLAVDRRLRTDRRAFVGFAVTLVVAPVVLSVFPLFLG
jgi:sodium-dependent phosphate cotransporter